MQLEIKTMPCNDNTGLFLAEIQRGTYDGNKPNAPLQFFAYGETEIKAHKNLERKLGRIGVEVMNPKLEAETV